MAEYINKQRAKDLMGCCLASAKANLKTETSIFKRAEFESIIKTVESMIDVVGAVESADVQPVNQWISVKDRLPNEDDCYLVVIESEICVSIDIAEYSENRWHKHDKVLYWQPLPEPPKDGDAE